MEPLWSTLVPLGLPLLLLLLANGAPPLARYWLGSRFALPLDGGSCFIDGRPLLGAAKSWRGVLAAALATTVGGTLLGIAWWLALLFALLSLLGDALASFLKRRLAIPVHGHCLGLDQIPEALLPLWLLATPLGLDGVQVVVGTLLFMLLEITLSPLLYRWHLRSRPY
ncbi:MAG: CDP-archaeol synthase [Gammaproteobacteria bacterium]|nr:CDP-archaeol synthase [Gammaproteobacteria bacterium]